MVLLVVNNNGGQIFSLMPPQEAERQRFYCMPQDVDFSHAAAMFHLKTMRDRKTRTNWHKRLNRGSAKGGNSD